MEMLKNYFSEDVLSYLKNANILNVSDIFSLSKEELIEKTKLNPDVIDEVLSITSRLYFTPKLTNASKIPTWRRISTGCQSINLITHGGMPLNSITEIVGCSGVGKTQFCLQLALMTQLPEKLGGLGKDVVYMCTEDIFPSKRLCELEKFFHEKYKCSTNFQENILLTHISNYEHLMNCVSKQLKKLLKYRKIGLVIIDSIAGIFRGDISELSYVNRAEIFNSIGLHFRKLLSVQEFAVICVNQVAQNIETDETIPTLGLTWSNLITSRFFITRFVGSDIREFEVVFAPDLKNRKCKFRITQHGLIDAE